MQTKEEGFARTIQGHVGTKDGTGRVMKVGETMIENGMIVA